MITHIILFICLAYMLVIAAHTAVVLIFTDRKNRSLRLRNYKKGKFFALYAAALPLYLAAYIEMGGYLLQAIINTVNATLQAAFLSFDLDTLGPLMQTDRLFYVTVYIYMVLTVCNTLLFSVSLLFRRAALLVRLLRLRFGRRDICILLGFEAGNRSVLDSLNGKTTAILVLSETVTEEDCERLHIARAAYLTFRPEDGIHTILRRYAVGLSRRSCTVILQTGDHSKNLNYAFQLASFAETLGTDLLSPDGKKGFSACVFNELDADTVYRRVVRRSHGAVRCVNRYKMMAKDFSVRYPLTQFLPDAIDTTRAVLHRNTDFRVLMIGFGRVNRHLFRIYTQTNQYLMHGEDGLTELPLTYHIFDKDQTNDDATLNHTYRHFSRWLEKEHDPKDYLEIPPKPATTTFHKEDVNSRAFFEDLRTCLASGEHAFNLLVIALGDDILALDIAEKLSQTLRDWGHENDTRIFVRVHSAELLKQTKTRAADEIPIIPFGDDASLLTFDRIADPPLDRLAKDRHLCYAAETAGADKSEAEIYRAALEKWLFRWEDIQRESNVYASLVLRTRLHLLGFDCAPASDPRPDATEEYLAAYQKDDPIEYGGRVVNGKRVVDYDHGYYREGTVRQTLARIEHMRWNAYYICNGFVPASLSEYRAEGKDVLMRRRRHINLTTFDGLWDYARFRMETEGVDENDADVVRYDYQLMDDLPWLVTRNGYKIVRRITENK